MSPHFKHAYTYITTYLPICNTLTLTHCNVLRTDSHTPVRKSSGKGLFKSQDRINELDELNEHHILNDTNIQSQALRIINVLVVDDSATCRNMIRKTLLSGTDGCKIYCDQAGDGIKAVDLVRYNVNTYPQSSQSSLPEVHLTSIPSLTQDGENTISIEKVDQVTDPVDNSIKLTQLPTGLATCTPSLPSDLKTVAKGIYEVILMDYQMPNMDGPTAIREIRKLGYKGKIIGLTGNVLSNEMDIMRNAGADEVLSKPITPEVLEALLESL